MWQVPPAQMQKLAKQDAPTHRCRPLPTVSFSPKWWQPKKVSRSYSMLGKETELLPLEKRFKQLMLSRYRRVQCKGSEYFNRPAGEMGQWIEHSLWSADPQNRREAGCVLCNKHISPPPPRGEVGTEESPETSRSASSEHTAMNKERGQLTPEVALWPPRVLSHINGHVHTRAPHTQNQNNSKPLSENIQASVYL